MQTHTVPSEVLGSSASVAFSPRSLEDETLSVVISAWKRQLSVNAAPPEAGVASSPCFFYGLPKSRRLQQIEIIHSSSRDGMDTGGRCGDLGVAQRLALARGGALTDRKATPRCTAGSLRGERASVPKGPPQRARRGGRGLLCRRGSPMGVCAHLTRCCCRRRMSKQAQAVPDGGGTHQSGHFGVVWALAGSQRGRARFLLLLLRWRCPC